MNANDESIDALEERRLQEDWARQAEDCYMDAVAAFEDAAMPRVRSRVVKVRRRAKRGLTLSFPTAPRHMSWKSRVRTHKPWGDRVDKRRAYEVSDDGGGGGCGQVPAVRVDEVLAVAGMGLRGYRFFLGSLGKGSRGFIPYS